MKYVPRVLTQYTIAKAITFGNEAEKAAINEFVQLFKTKNALVPVKGKYLNR